MTNIKLSTYQQRVTTIRITKELVESTPLEAINIRPLIYKIKRPNIKIEINIVSYDLLKEKYDTLIAQINGLIKQNYGIRLICTFDDVYDLRQEDEELFALCYGVYIPYKEEQFSRFLRMCHRIKSNKMALYKTDCFDYDKTIELYNCLTAIEIGLKLQLTNHSNTKDNAEALAKVLRYYRVNQTKESPLANMRAIERALYNKKIASKFFSVPIQLESFDVDIVKLEQETYYGKHYENAKAAYEATLNENCQACPLKELCLGHLANHLVGEESFTLDHFEEKCAILKMTTLYSLKES